MGTVLKMQQQADDNETLESLKQKCCEYFTIYGFPEYQIRHNKQSVLEYFEKFGLKINCYGKIKEFN